MPNVKAQLIRALARFMANHDAKIKRITSTEGFKKASMATRTIYEQTYKFVNCCVNCTTKMVTEQGKTIAANIKEEYQNAVKEQEKQAISGSSKGPENCDCSKFSPEELKGKKKK